MTLTEFAHEKADGLLRYATVLCCDPHLAQDIVQEVLLRAGRHWDRIEAMEAPVAYVKRMITNEFLSLRRRRRVRQIVATHQAIEVLAEPAPDPSRDVDERDAMLASITTLPPKQRAAVVLRYYEYRSDEEIAQILHCGESTVRTHLHRAMRTLRAAYLDQAGTSAQDRGSALGRGSAQYRGGARGTGGARPSGGAASTEETGTGVGRIA